jgi:hypothetical protein
VGAVDEVGVGEDGEVGRQRGRHPLDAELADGPDHAGDGRVAVRAPDDQLADQVVVELADLVPGLVATVPADPEPLRRHQRGDPSRRGQEPALGRVLGVDPHLDAVAPAFDVLLGEAQPLARGDPDLLAHQVDPGDELGDRVLHLQPRVHLQEEELAVLEEELDGAGVDVAAGLRHLHRGLAHRLALVGLEARGG